MVDRRAARRARRLQVSFSKRGDPHGYPGFTTNISRTGMFIGTHHPFVQGTRLRIEVIDRDHGFIVEGLVVHSRRVGIDLGRLLPSGMGIRFLTVDELVRELVPGAEGEEIYTGPAESAAAARAAAAAAAGPPEARAVDPAAAVPSPPAGAGPGAAPGAPSELAMPEPRQALASAPTPAPAPATTEPPVAGSTAPLAAGRVFSVRFADAAQLAAVFQRDIVNGGLFVSTPEPARLQEMVAIDLHPPGPPGQETEPIRCRARVVHRVEPRPTSGVAGKNLLAGMGVELLDATSVAERLRAVVERLGRG